MRNVVTLSNIPLDLHQWLRDEAQRESEKAGKRVPIYTIVIKAVEQYRDNAENHHPEKEVANVTN